MQRSSTRSTIYITLYKCIIMEKIMQPSTVYSRINVVLYIYFCLFVCLYPIKSKSVKPIRSNIFLGPQMTPGKKYGPSKLEKSTGFFFEKCAIILNRKFRKDFNVVSSNRLLYRIHSNTEGF